jgi:hypothetical protein
MLAKGQPVIGAMQRLWAYIPSRQDKPRKGGSQQKMD